jgi:hypothetical protein
MKTFNQAPDCQSMNLFLMMAISELTCSNGSQTQLSSLKNVEVIRYNLNKELKLDYHLDHDAFYLNKISYVSAVIVSCIRGYKNQDHQQAMINYRLTFKAENAFHDKKLKQGFDILTSGWSIDALKNAMNYLLDYNFQLHKELVYESSSIHEDLCIMKDCYQEAI